MKKKGTAPRGTLPSLWLALGFVALLTGCASSSRLRTADYDKEPIDLVSSDNVRVYSTHEIGLPYQTIGLVVADADAGESADKAVKILRQEASRLGANAIVDLDLEFNMGFWTDAIRATGVAVRYEGAK